MEQNDGSSISYGKTQYWDDRGTVTIPTQKDPASFDWYQRWAGLATVIYKHLKKPTDVLIAGCGTSRLGADMLDEGFKAVTAVDISLTVINMMAELSSQTHPALNFMHMNVCSLEFPDESFDAVIAKATMDVIMCGEGSVGNVAKMCFEVSRVLRPGGVFFVVSHEKDYMQYLDPETANKDFGWSVTQETVLKPCLNPKLLPTDEKGNLLVHHIYICKKKSDHGTT